MLDNFINGRWRVPASGSYLELSQPMATGRFPVQVARSGVGDIEEALDAADVASERWSRLGRADRKSFVTRLPTLVADRQIDALLGDCTARVANHLALSDTLIELFRTRLLDQLETAFARIRNGSAEVEVGNGSPERIVLSAAADPLDVFTRMFQILFNGNTCVAAIIVSRQQLSDAWVAASFCTIAASLPPGVINVVIGLGLEVGVPLGAAGWRDTPSDPRPCKPTRLRPSHFQPLHAARGCR